MVFQPGQSGNPGGKPKTKPFKDALLIEAKAAENEEPCVAPKGSLRWNARQLLEQGDVPSIREIADRLDGKPVQAVEGEMKVSADETISGLLQRVAAQGGRLAAPTEET